MLVTLCRLAGTALLVAAVIALRQATAGSAPGPADVDSRGRVRRVPVLSGGRARAGPDSSPALAPGQGLAFALEVWAALLAAGQPLGPAIESVAGCSGAGLSGQLRVVSDGLAAGRTSAEAWAAISGWSVVLDQVGRACARSELDGTSMVPVLRRLAADERAAAASRGLIGARRAGVLAVVPLGLCTLPAYVALSVAPAVIGLIHHGP